MTKADLADKIQEKLSCHMKEAVELVELTLDTDGVLFMKAKYRHLSEHSLSMALSAIEIYNKPAFRNREQIFAILISAAWETLLKAKTVKDNQNKITSIYVKDGFRYRQNRTGEYLTIGIEEAKQDANSLS